MSLNDVNNLISSKYTYELLAFNSKETKVISNLPLNWKERLGELAQAVLFSLPIVTLLIGSVRQHWSSFWAGRKIEVQTLQSDQIHPHRRALLNKVNLQQQLMIQGKTWNEILQDVPQAFEFAPYAVKSNPLLAKFAIQGDAAMVKHIAESLKNSNFLQPVAVENPKVIFFLKQPLSKEIFDALPAGAKAVFQQTSTGIHPDDMKSLQSFIEEYSPVWLDHLKASGQEFLYLKSKFLQLNYSIQIFKDGTKWIHSKEVVGSGLAHNVKAVYDWDAKKSYVKVSVKKHLRQMGNRWGGNRTAKQVGVYQKLLGKRGIVPMIGAFDYPSKSGEGNQKTSLVLKRYTGSLDQLRKWTKEDLKVIARDLLHAVKALNEADLTEGDFNEGNALVLCDENGRAVEAGIVDFEQTEVLSVAKKKEGVDNPRALDFYFQDEVVRVIKKLYRDNGIEYGKKLAAARYFKADVYDWATYTEDRIPADPDTLIQEIEQG